MVLKESTVCTPWEKKARKVKLCYVAHGISWSQEEERSLSKHL